MCGYIDKRCNLTQELLEQHQIWVFSVPSETMLNQVKCMTISRTSCLSQSSSTFIKQFVVMHLTIWKKYFVFTSEIHSRILRISSNGQLNTSSSNGLKLNIVLKIVWIIFLKLICGTVCNTICSNLYITHRYLETNYE